MLRHVQHDRRWWLLVTCASLSVPALIWSMRWERPDAATTGGDNILTAVAFQDEAPQPDDPKPSKPARGPKKNGKKAADPKVADPKAADPAAAPPADENAPPAEIKKDPEGRCAICRDTRFAPFEKFQPYYHVEGQKAPKPEACVPWRFCPACSADQDIQDLVTQEAERLKTAGEKHKEWEGRTKLAMVRVETRHVTLHAEMPLQLAARQGEAAEALTRHLQTLTKSVVLTPSRPQTFDLVILWDTPGYQRFVQTAKNLPEFAGTEDWDLILQVAGFAGNGVKVYNAFRNQQTPCEHMTISQVAEHQIYMATDRRCKSWLGVGFPYYCEFALKRKNLVSRVKYMLGERPLGDNWNTELKRAAAARKLRPFEDMFPLDLRDYQPADHLMCFSMVSYLIRSNPEAFVRFVLLIRDGKEDKEALETAYGVTIQQLQGEWEKWAARL